MVPFRLRAFAHQFRARGPVGVGLEFTMHSLRAELPVHAWFSTISGTRPESDCRFQLWIASLSELVRPFDDDTFT